MTNQYKAMQCNKTMPASTSDRILALAYVMSACEELAVRLRCRNLKGQRVAVSLLTETSEQIGGEFETLLPTNNSLLLYRFCKKVLAAHWRGEAVCQVQMTVLEPQSASRQIDMPLYFPVASNTHLYQQAAV